MPQLRPDAAPSAEPERGEGALLLVSEGESRGVGMCGSGRRVCWECVM